MFVLTCFCEAAIRSSSYIESFVPLSFLHIGVARGVNSMECRRSIEGKRVRRDPNHRTIFLMIEEVADVTIADIGLPEERPSAYLVGQRTGE